MTLDELVALLNQLTIRFTVRRGTASEWTTSNEVLLVGEIGWESDTGKFKFGNGVDAWDDLDYFKAGTSLSAANAGPGISIDDTDPDVPVISAIVSGINLKGTVTTYAGLPSSGNTNGDAYYCYADSLVYVYQSGFPASGNGISIGLDHNPKFGSYWAKDVSNWIYVSSSNNGSSFVASEMTGYTSFGTFSYSSISGTAPPSLTMSTGANAAGYCRVFFRGGPNLNLTAGAIEANWWVNLPAASTSSERYNVSFSFTDVISGGFNQRVNCTYSDNINSGNFQLTWLSGGSLVTTVNTSVPPPINTIFKLTAKVNAAGNSVSFYVNDALIGSITIAPTIALGANISINKSVGSSARTVLFHGFTLRQTYNNPLP